MKSEFSGSKTALYNDDYLVRAMKKWPNVPEVFGWLKLNRKGEWLIKDQSISHVRTKNFLNQHYFSDKKGNWFVQNGPQRVFVELEYTPYVYRLNGTMPICTTTGKEASNIKSFLLDEQGNILVQTDLGIGIIYDKDLLQIIPSLDDRVPNHFFLHWQSFNYFLIYCHSKIIPKIFQFNPAPHDETDGNY